MRVTVQADFHGASMYRPFVHEYEQVIVSFPVVEQVNEHAFSLQELAYPAQRFICNLIKALLSNAIYLVEIRHHLWKLI